MLVPADPKRRITSTAVQAPGTTRRYAPTKMKIAYSVVLLRMLGTTISLPVPDPNLVVAAEVSFDEKAKLENLEKFTNIPFKKLGHSRQSVENVLGTPRKVQVSQVFNRHDPSVIDRIYFLKFDGASVEIYDATLNRQFLVFFSLERILPILGLPVQMGTSPRTVKSLFGEPDGDKKDVLDYSWAYENDTARYRVIFYFKESKLTRIDWRVFLD